MTTLEILRAAREFHSNPANWVKGAEGYWTMEGRCCIASAIDRFGREDDSNWDACSKAWVLIFTETGDAISIAHWNDDPARIHAEVLDLYDRVIAKLEAEANANR